jgi:hypothetical protein
MHSKNKGSIGELAIALDLSKKGYSVFKEFGDLSKVDLIILINNVPIKIQVKALKTKNGSIVIKNKKAGPNYRFKYSENEVDIFAVYILDTQDIIYISAKQLIAMHDSLSIRVAPSKNHQKKKINFIDDYKDLKEALKGP